MDCIRIINPVNPNEFQFEIPIVLGTNFTYDEFGCPNCSLGHLKDQLLHLAAKQQNNSELIKFRKYPFISLLKQAFPFIKENFTSKNLDELINSNDQAETNEKRRKVLTNWLLKLNLPVRNPA